MTAVRWVLDTNVVVSGLLSAGGPPGRLVDAALSGVLRLVYDDRIAAEYHEVLARPRLGIAEAQREAFLAVLALHDLVVAQPWVGARPPDPDDLMFLEVALAAEDRILVTGNARHFPRAVRGSVRVLSPVQALERLHRRRPVPLRGRRAT